MLWLSILDVVLATHQVIPLDRGPFDELVRRLRPDVLVDARMRKHQKPETQLERAPLTIGPGFVAGENTDIAIETSWEDPDKVVERGATLPLRGEPQAILGRARDRCVYAPVTGTFRSLLEIGARVRADDPVAKIAGTPLHAPLDGVLRGLTKNGVHVSVGTKVIEVDPRGDDAQVAGLGERPRRIAEGVLRALTSWADREAG